MEVKMEKQLVKQGRRIVGFVGMNNGRHFYAFGKPSQREYMAFDCNSVESGIMAINEYSKGF